MSFRAFVGFGHRPLSLDSGTYSYALCFDCPPSPEMRKRLGE
jgi:hypothetical protein